MKLKIFLFASGFLVLFAANDRVCCRDLKALLVEASSVEGIMEDFQRFKGFGHPEWARFSNGGKEIFAIWSDPFSGRSAVIVRAYFYNGKRWILFLDKWIENTSTLSVMFLKQKSSEMVFYSVDNKMVIKCSLSDLKPLHTRKI